MVSLRSWLRAFGRVEAELVLVRRRVLLWGSLAICAMVAGVAGLGLFFALQAGRRAEVVESIVCDRAAIRPDAFTPAQARHFEAVCGVRLVLAGGELKVVGSRR